MKLLFLSNVPSPYRVDFFNELGKYCDLTVLFEKTTSDERDESWKKYQFNTFRGIFLRGKTISVLRLQSILEINHLNILFVLLLPHQRGCGRFNI